jgi:hypothetical protein
MPVQNTIITTGTEDVVTLLKELRLIGISTISIGELLSGFKGGGGGGGGGRRTGENLRSFWTPHVFGYILSMKTPLNSMPKF